MIDRRNPLASRDSRLTDSDPRCAIRSGHCWPSQLQQPSGEAPLRPGGGRPQFLCAAHLQSFCDAQMRLYDGAGYRPRSSRDLLSLWKLHLSQKGFVARIRLEVLEHRIGLNQNAFCIVLPVRAIEPGESQIDLPSKCMDLSNQIRLPRGVFCF